jgi:hypothetical protein
MAVLGSVSGMSSATPSVSDLDGYSFQRDYFPGHGYNIEQDDEFGFDPPRKPSSLNDYQVYSPPEDYPSSQWPEFKLEDDSKQQLEKPINLDAYEMDRFISSTLPNAQSTVSRYGQITPPRSNSETSVTKDDKSKAQTGEPRRRGKGRKQLESAENATTKANSGPGRKRKSTKKAMPEELLSGPEDSKRKQSLEKNRLAAAKCRVGDQPNQVLRGFAYHVLDQQERQDRKAAAGFA